MIARLISLAVRGRWYVVALTLIIAALGLWQLTKLPVDAVPDVTNKQVQINTVESSLSPVEIEKPPAASPSAPTASPSTGPRPTFPAAR